MTSIQYLLTSFKSFPTLRLVRQLLFLFRVTILFILL
jgi:hypothetical protein